MFGPKAASSLAQNINQDSTPTISFYKPMLSNTSQMRLFLTATCLSLATITVGCNQSAPSKTNNSPQATQATTQAKTQASSIAQNNSSSQPPAPTILDGRYALGGTGQGLEVEGDRYRYTDEEGPQSWQSVTKLTAIKEGVIYDGNNHWCLITMKLREQIGGCSEAGWVIHQTSTSASKSLQNDASQKIEDFIPQGWQIEKEVSGDLNNDGQADRVIQIVEAGDSGERQRSLLILQTASSGWKKIATAPKLLLCSSCAGAMGGPKGEHIRLNIEDGVLIVNQLAGSRGAIAMTHRFWIDQASQKMILIGEDLKPYDRANGNEITDSRNFLTGKRIVEEYQGQGNAQKKLIRTQTLTVSQEMREIESVDIEVAQRSAPNLPD
jgi:hypothetical protein